MIDALNQDQAGELSVIAQYITYAATATGPYRPQFHLNKVPDEQAHAQYLASTIVALGGEPNTKPREVKPAKTNSEMVEAVREAEQRAVNDYTKRARQAEEFGDKGLVAQLEDIVRDETGHL